MTREEAIQIISEYDVNFGYHTEFEIVDALEMAIQALSQKPCELLIIKSNILLHQEDRKKWMESIKREKENGVIILPPYFEPLLVPNDIEISIEQEPKTGKWIDKEFRKEEYVLAGKCSVCGRVRVIDKFCSNCGAKMESEDKHISREDGE